MNNLTLPFKKAAKLAIMSLLNGKNNEEKHINNPALVDKNKIKFIVAKRAARRPHYNRKDAGINDFSNIISDIITALILISIFIVISKIFHAII